MSNNENGRDGADSRAEAVNGKSADGHVAASAQSVVALQKTVAQLREENVWLRHQLALRLFPPETSPPFDPSEFTLTTWDEILADLKSVEQR